MTTLIAACVLILVSAGAGYALYALAGRTEWTWTAPAVGFAGLLAMAPLAFALPGTTITVGLVALLATLAGAWLLRGTPRPDGLVWGVAMVAVAILWLCVPFVVNGRFGLLGVSFNDDTRFHLWAAEYLAHGLDVPANVLFHGYPLGPHTIAGALSRCLGLPIEAALDAVLIAGPVVAGLAAFGVLSDAAPARRFLVGLLVALPFMLASYYAQAAFKETILASLVLAYAVELRDLERSGRLSLRAGLPFGVLVAGAIAAFTYPALLFFGAITFTVGLAALAQARFERTPLSEHFSLRAVAACAGGAALVLLIALLPRLASLVDSFDVIGSSPAGSGAIAADNIGNLVSPISLFAAFSQWPIDDFRYQPHGLLRDVMVVLGVSAAAYGTIWWSQRRDFVVPTAAVTALLIFLFVRQRESAYVAAKALCVAAPLLMLMAASAVTARPPRLVVVGLLAGVAFVAGAGYSTFLTLRNAQVGPSAHEDELAELRSVVDGQKVLYLAFDNFGGVRLFGSEVTIPPVQAPAGYTIRPGKTYDTNDPLDFDWPNDETLDRYPYVITSSGTYGSTPPPNFRVVRTTRSYKLWQRTGPTPQHNVLLDEGSKTGAILDCTTTRGRAIARSGWTAVVTPKPRLFQGPAGGGVGAGATVALELDLPRGRSDLSMQYRSSQDLEVSAPGLRTTLPASLDGLGPYWKLGAVDMPEAGTLTLTITMDKPSPFFARSQFAAIPSIAATSPAPPQRKPIADACGDWVDSYYAP